MVRIKPIRTTEDHAQALETLERLMNAASGSKQADDFEVLALVVDAYESEHFPIPPPDPIEAILFRLEQQGLTRKALEPIMGSRAKVSEVLNRRRGLSLAMIRALHAQFEIPLESLMSETKTPETKTPDDRRSAKTVAKRNLKSLSPKKRTRAA